MEVQSENYVFSPNLLMFEGNDKELIVANANNVNILYMQNGDKFKKLLESGQVEDKDLIEIFRNYNILVNEQVEINEPRKGVSLCNGSGKNYTLNLILDDKYNEKVFDKSIYYKLSILENGSTLNIVLYCEDCLEKIDEFSNIVEMVNGKLDDMNSDINIQYHIYSYLKQIPDKFISLTKGNCINLTVLVLWDNEGIFGKEKIIKNVQQAVDSGVFCTLVAPVTKDNISHFENIIIEAYKNISGPFNVEFPALKKSNHPWEYGQLEQLPDPNEYCKLLSDIYKSQIFIDDEFYPISEIRHRIVNGGYKTSCISCYDLLTAVDTNGTVFPCVQGKNVESFEYGNILINPEKNYSEVSQAMQDLQSSDNNICTKCNYKTLCGTFCAIEQESSNASCNVEYIKDYYCTPRKRIIVEILWDIVKSYCPSQNN